MSNTVNKISIVAESPSFLIGDVGVNQANVVLDLDQPMPPDTTAQQQPDWDLFSWNTFIALNWPAKDPKRGQRPSARLSGRV